MTPRAWLVSLIWLGTVTVLHLIPRSEFYTLWSTYSIAFAAYIWLSASKGEMRFTTGIVLALLARFISFFFEPLLSDDYFRFIWDGMLWDEGIHPMAYTPDELVRMQEIILPDTSLYYQLNHTAYHSVYPPLTQGIYSLSYAVNQMNTGGHILFLKSVSICTDGLIFYLLFRILRLCRRSTHVVLWYALNPLVVLEYTGNLHADNLMIAGWLGAILLTLRQKPLWAGIFMGLSILSKMLSALSLPFFPYRSYKRESILLGSITLLISVGGFMVFFGTNTGWIESVALWFNTFEFNAGIYYVVRSLGQELWGYNRIALIGPLLAVTAVTGIVLIWWRYAIRKRMAWTTAMLYAFTLYFLLGTTIHPWYLGMLLVAGILASRSYPMVWTYLVVLSYSHYLGGEYAEQYMLIAAEYALLTGWMIWEWRWCHQKEKPV